MPAVTVNVPVAVPAEIVRLEGSASRDELELSDTVAPPEVTCDRVTAQLVLPPDIRPVAPQLTLETTRGASNPIVAVCEPLPSAAVTVAF